MTILRNKRKLAAVSRKKPENTRNSLSKNTLDPWMAQEYISQVSEEIEGTVTKKLFKEFSRTQSRIFGALSKLDEFLVNPQVRTSSVVVPETSRNSGSENWEPTADRSLGDPCPEAVFSTYCSSNLNDPEQEETHHHLKLNFLSPNSSKFAVKCNWNSKNCQIRAQFAFFSGKKCFLETGLFKITQREKFAVESVSNGIIS